MSFTTGDADIKLKNVKVHNARDVTAKDIVNEAKDICKKMRARKIKPGDFDAADKFMAEMRKEHKEFAESYPIVLRYICQMQQFSAKALSKYLNYIKEHPWKNEDEYLDSQAQYVVMLYKETHPRWDTTQVANLRKNIRTMLQKEHDRFIELSDKYKEQVEHEEKGYKVGRDETMTSFYQMYGKEIDDMHIRTKTEIPTDNLVSVDSLVNSELDSGFDREDATNNNVVLTEPNTTEPNTTEPNTTENYNSQKNSTVTSMNSITISADDLLN